ncbi:MAG TPA: hypothetical protein VEI97_08555 [bacterium]|nr:hypothetical protein [bacterium]
MEAARHRWPELRYALGWLLAAVVAGWGTLLLIQTAPEEYPVDRRNPDADAPDLPQSVVASQVKIQEVDPATQEVRWELKVPETAGGPTSASSFENPEITLFPSTNGFRIRAASAILAEAPAGQIHGAANAHLELKGPIEGRSADGTQSFTADTAVWRGEETTLTLTGNPLTLRRGNIDAQARRLMVTFFPDKPPQYDLEGAVSVTVAPD